MAVMHDANFPEAKSVDKLPDGVGQRKQSSDPLEVLKEIQAQDALREYLANRNNPPHKEGENLATAIVSKAMEISASASKEYKELAQKSNEALEHARDKADDAKQDMFKTLLNQIEKVADNLAKTQAANQPKSTIDVIREAKELHSLLFPAPTSPLPQQYSPSSDNNITLQIKKMEQDFQLAMKKYDIELDNMKTDREFRAKQWQSDYEFKKQEFEDKKASRDAGMSTLSDIAASFAAGLRGRTGEALPVEDLPTPAISAKPDETTTPEPAETTFNCRKCGMPITFDPNVRSFKCPNPQCGAQYVSNEEKERA